MNIENIKSWKNNYLRKTASAMTEDYKKLSLFKKLRLRLGRDRGLERFMNELSEKYGKSK